MRYGYVVESRVEIQTKEGHLKAGTAQHWVASEARAQSEVAKLPTRRTYRAVPWDQLPMGIRNEFERAEAEKSCEVVEQEAIVADNG